MHYNIKFFRKNVTLFASFAYTKIKRPMTNYKKYLIYVTAAVLVLTTACDKDKDVTGVTLNESEYTLEPGDTFVLRATVLPDGADDKTVFWTSSDLSVATVSDYGLVTAISVGKVEITVRTQDGNKTATCAVTVNPLSVAEITINRLTLTLLQDSKVNHLVVTILPEDAHNKAVTWSSNNEDIVSVSSSGELTAKAVGTATITVMTDDGGKTAACVVNVIPGIEMVFVPGINFIMGCKINSIEEFSSVCFANQLPQHIVRVSSFYIGKYAVTQGQWMAIMGYNPSGFIISINHPVENISWNDVQEFIERLNEATGKSYRLPTESEWEIAACGSTHTNRFIYSGSNNLDDVAWHGGNSNNSTHAVGSKQANELGIYDMSGNVWEMCSDWYGVYTAESKIDPTGPSSGTERVIRGGAFSGGLYAQYRPAFRDRLNIENRYLNVGFRLAHP